MFKLAKLTDYGIVVASRFAEGDELAIRTAKDVAAQVKLPQPTVSKLLKTLARGGILNSNRGMKGGYRLTRPADTISLAEVIEALEGPVQLTDCVANRVGRCKLRGGCPARPSWTAVNALVVDALQKITLAQVSAQDKSTPAPAPRRRAAARGSQNVR